MSLFHLCFLSIVFCCFTGCGSQAPGNKRSESKPTSKEFTARLDAAKSIRNWRDHDNALADLAKDAADAGEATVAKNAIKTIRDTSVFNDAAAEAAVLLAKNGKSAEATEVAKLIRDTALSDKTLARIAKGD